MADDLRYRHYGSGRYPCPVWAEYDEAARQQQDLWSRDVALRNRIGVRLALSQSRSVQIRRCGTACAYISYMRRRWMAVCLPVLLSVVAGCSTPANPASENPQLLP